MIIWFKNTFVDETQEKMKSVEDTLINLVDTLRQLREELEWVDKELSHEQGFRHIFTETFSDGRESIQ